MNALSGPGGMGGYPQIMDAQAMALKAAEQNPQGTMDSQSQLQLSQANAPQPDTRVQGLSIPGLGEQLDRMV